MVDLSGITSTIGGSMAGIGQTLLKFMSYLFISVFILGIFWFFYYYMQHRIKAEVYIRRASGTDDYSIGKVINTKIRTIKRNGIPMWQFWLRKETMKPLDDEYILPGNRVKLFKVGETYHPFVLRCGNPTATFTPYLLPEIRLWQALEIQQANQEYQDLKAKLLPGFITIATIVVCLVFVGFVVWFTTREIGGVVTAVNNLASSWDLQNVAQKFTP